MRSLRCRLSVADVVVAGPLTSDCGIFLSILLLSRFEVTHEFRDGWFLSVTAGADLASGVRGGCRRATQDIQWIKVRTDPQLPASIRAAYPRHQLAHQRANVPETPSLPSSGRTHSSARKGTTNSVLHFGHLPLRAGLFVLDFQHGFAAGAGVSNGHSATRTNSARSGLMQHKAGKRTIWQFTEITVRRCP